MAQDKIFITGSTGCIGHYVLDEFLSPQAIKKYELHLLVRDPSRLKFDYKAYKNIFLHIGNIEFIEEQAKTIADMNYIIHIATDWSNSEYATVLNVEKTHKMFNYCHAKNLKKIIYFSTASILGPKNRLIAEAEKYGTGYIRSKYLAYKALEGCKYRHKIITLFPSLVFGGDKNHPYSHISSGIIPNLKFLKWLRFIYVPSTFHFLHSYDIAQVTKYLLENPNPQNDYVLGNPVITGKETIRALCKAFNIRQYFSIRIPTKFLFKIADNFNIEVAPWDRYCILNPFFEYDVVSPGTFGLKTKFPTLELLLKDIKENQRNR